MGPLLLHVVARKIFNQARAAVSHTQEWSIVETLEVLFR